MWHTVSLHERSHAPAALYGLALAGCEPHPTEGALGFAIEELDLVSEGKPCTLGAALCIKGNLVHGGRAIKGETWMGDGLGQRERHHG